MKTYSKRHRPPYNNDPDNVVVNGQKNRKRVYHSETEGRPRKRKKADQPAMPSTFETPQPTLEANSEVYKLPSTKPIPSPTPFSPVPIAAPTRSLGRRSRPYFVPTTSGSLKENARSSHHTSKTLSSFTLTSGPGPVSRNTYKNGKQTRSPSRSSNSTSSRSRSRDQTRLSKFKAKLIKKSKVKPTATTNDLSEHHPTKPRDSTRSKRITKRKKSILLISNAEQTLLASPFASRAPSPTDCSNSDTAKSGLAPEPKLVLHNRGLLNSKRDNLAQVCDAFSSPEKLGMRRRSSARLFNRGPEITNEHDFPWKNRRPSAPSNLQRPSRPVGKVHTPAKRATTPSHKFKDNHEINFKSEHRKSALPRPVDPVKDWDNQLSVELNGTPDPFFWMQERSAVDFNRPPSQLSIQPFPRSVHAEDDAEAEGVFWSSGEDNDGNNERSNQRLGANPEATNSALPTSTPYKIVLARRLSVPILDEPSTTGPKCRESLGASGTIDYKSDEDMELTTPLECGGNLERCQQDSMSFQEHTPWITDSIISPPTAYSERKNPAVEKGVDQNVEKEERLASVEPGLKTSSPYSLIFRTQTGVLSSPFKHSYAESTSSVVESASMGLHELAIEDQELKEEITVKDVTDKSAIVQQRTRSGTILAARNGPNIARRTRTGTIVGPSTVGRTRSGTIVAKANIAEQNVAAVGNRRARSGSVIGLASDASGKKGVRSNGPVADLELNAPPPAEERAHGSVDGGLTQIEIACNDKGCKSTIREVNEAECYVDSLYLTSSPDPINFLTGTKIDGDESTLVVAIGDWQVADGPPSPEIRRTKKTIQTPRAVGNRSTTWRFKSKGRKNRARFLDPDGQVEDCEFDNPSNLNFEDGLNDTSDDELLLVEGQSQSLFG